MVHAQSSEAFGRSPRLNGSGIDPTLRSVIEVVEQPVAVLDAEGTVVATNGAWRAGFEDFDCFACDPGENYLDWCNTLRPAAAGTSLARGVKRVLRGTAPDYSQSARLAAGLEGRQVRVRIQRLGAPASGLAHSGSRLYLVSHEAEDALGDDLEDRVLAAQQEERERLAAELHDSVGQNLVCLGLGLTRLRRLSGTNQEIEAVVADMTEALEQAHAEIRTLSFLLRPAWLDEPGAFIKAVRDLVAGFARRAGLEATVEVAGAPRGLCRAHELTLFRIIQEALVNVHRHAHARAIEVVLTHSGRNVLLTVRDDGQGIAAAEGLTHPGVGLLSMQARLRRCGGELRIVSGHDGTILTANLPA